MVSSGPAGVVNQLRTDASVQPFGYGFTGDPNSQSAGRYYGYLTVAR